MTFPIHGALAVVIAVAGATIAVAQTVAPAPAADPERVQTAALFEKTCSGCHELEQAISQPQDVAGWHATVERMVGYGAALTPAEQDRIARYLATEHGVPAAK